MSHLEGQLSQTNKLVTHSVLLRVLFPPLWDFFKQHLTVKPRLTSSRLDQTSLKLIILLPWPLE